MISARLKNRAAKSGLNKRMIHFFTRLFILFSVWFVCYNIILKPTRVIDKPLTHFLTAVVTKIINFLSPNTAPLTWEPHQTRNCGMLIQNDRSVFEVYDVCNGIDLMFIYAGIIFLLPYPLKRKIYYSIAGIIAIILFNIVRIVSLYFIYVYQRSAFDFSHHYMFTLLMYVLIFYGWLLFIKRGRHYHHYHEKSS